MKMKMSEQTVHATSFRDPSGFVFRANGVYYRQVNKIYAANYDLLMDSGLYRVLTEKKLLIPHTESEETFGSSPDRYKTLLPRQLPMISYPVEWAPDQLRDAALLTLQILELAIDHGMVLKDANPQNIQFPAAAPLFIDTLSFEKYDPSRPWVAYRQFCECFVFPLYIHHYRRTGTHKILSSYPEGIPAGVTAGMLPWKSRFNGGAWMHVFLQSRINADVARIGSDKPHGAGGVSQGAGGARHAFSKTKLIHLLRHLRHILEGLKLDGHSVSAWSNYYSETIPGGTYLGAKEKLFMEFTEGIDPGSVLDLGANDGHFSRLLSKRMAAGMDPSADPGSPVSAQIVAVDSDWQSINALYCAIRGRHTSASRPLEQPARDILPLCVDIADPTPAAGFRNKERINFTERVHSDMVIALALVHHLALGRNIPLPGIARYLAELTKNRLIIEFVPLTDEKARELIRNRAVWHTPYDAEAFERCLGEYFHIEARSVIPGTERILYRMKKNVPGDPVDGQPKDKY
jgi:hypothetical protein